MSAVTSSPVNRSPPELFLLALFVRCGGGSFVPRLTGEGIVARLFTDENRRGVPNPHGCNKVN